MVAKRRATHTKVKVMFSKSLPSLEAFSLSPCAASAFLSCCKKWQESTNTFKNLFVNWFISQHILIPQKRANMRYVTSAADNCYFFQFWTQRQTVMGTGPQATGNRSARPTHLSKFLSFVQLMPGYTCSFFCCGTRKEAHLQGGRRAFIKHLSGSHEQTVRWWSPEKTR